MARLEVRQQSVVVVVRVEEGPHPVEVVDARVERVHPLEFAPEDYVVDVTGNEEDPLPNNFLR